MTPRKPAVPRPKRRGKSAQVPAPAADQGARSDIAPTAPSFDTNVAPDLIEAGRKPDRSERPDEECSLPPDDLTGTPD